MTNPQNRDPGPLPMGIQLIATSETIFDESNRVMLEEFEKFGSRTNDQYKTLIVWAAKTIKDAFVAVGKTVSCRSRATDVVDVAVLQPVTQPREHVPGKAAVGRQGTRRDRQASQENLAARQHGDAPESAQPQEDPT